MPIASVNITLLDGALGVIPSSTVGHVAVVAGPSSAGPLLTPTAFIRPRDVETNFGYGPLVDYACAAIGRTGKPAVIVRTDTTTDAAYTTVDYTNVDGTSVPAADTDYTPYDEYEPYVVIITGGTVGVTGITYKWSLDGGRTLSAETALSTNNYIRFPSGNVAFDLGSGTLVAGDYFFCRTTPPMENTSDFADAMTCIGETGYDWDFATFATPMTGTQAGAVDTWLQSLWDSKSKHKAARISARGPAVNETEAAYLASLTADFASVASVRMAVSAGYCEFTSSATGARQYRRPASWITTCRALSKKILPWRNDLGQVDLGNLGSDVRIRAANGDRKSGLHDESLDPGFDAKGFETLTQLEGFKGVYCTTPRIMSNIGSDYYLWQYAAVVNRAADACSRKLMARCRKYIFVDKTTGYITEPEARDINKEVESEVKNAVGDGVSALSFAVGQADNLLAQNAHVTGDLRIVPLAYPAGFDITIGFVNPATGVTA
jgi:hypothetical protein